MTIHSLKNSLFPEMINFIIYLFINGISFCLFFRGPERIFQQIWRYQRSYGYEGPYYETVKVRQILNSF